MKLDNNQIRIKNGLEQIKIRFASDNPRNPDNQTSTKESNILKQFNNNEITEYTEILDNATNNTYLYHAIPTKITTNKCMRCHSDPKIAPKGLIELYGDKNGFYEKEGVIRAILSVTYPLTEDMRVAHNNFVNFMLIMTTLMSMALLVVYKVFKNIKTKNNLLETLNSSLDSEVIKRTQELDEEKKYIHTILDTNPNIIMVMTNDTIASVNKRFFDFFNVSSLDEIGSISDCFISIDDNKFPNNNFNKINWAENLAEDDKIYHILLLKYNNQEYYFRLNAQYLANHNGILFTLQDITEDKKKDKMLFEQSKLASMGEMIGNIAHQWRQPLSVISTGITGMQVQKDLDILSDDNFQKICDLINDNAQYLSATIEDFQNFIKNDRILHEFNLEDMLNSFLHLVEPTIKDNHLNVILNLQDNIKITGYPNELKQCLLNIFNNAKDALTNLEDDKRYIFITTSTKSNQYIIKIKDNAGGINNDIIKKIFEPYFTTKHQSQGTGLGLHMTYNLIVMGMKGTILVTNEQFIVDDISYTGAEFTITLPI